MCTLTSKHPTNQRAPGQSRQRDPPAAAARLPLHKGCCCPETPDLLVAMQAAAWGLEALWAAAPNTDMAGDKESSPGRLNRDYDSR